MPPKLIAVFLCARDAQTYADICLSELDLHGNLSTVDVGIGGRSRVLRFGWSYDYTEDHRPVPHWITFLSIAAESAIGLGPFFNSFVLNEYLPGSFITAHLDPNCDDPVAILSLQSSGEMWFRPVMDCNAKPTAVVLPIGSLLLMTGDSLRQWTHEIPPVKENRLSIVFRRRSDS